MTSDIGTPLVLTWWAHVPQLLWCWYDELLYQDWSGPAGADMVSSCTRTGLVQLVLIWWAPVPGLVWSSWFWYGEPLYHNWSGPAVTWEMSQRVGRPHWDHLGLSSGFSCQKELFAQGKILHVCLWRQTWVKHTFEHFDLDPNTEYESNTHLNTLIWILTQRRKSPSTH